MQDATYLILLSLADQPRHGYGILQEVAELSGHETQLGAGTLYGALERLAALGHVELDHETVERGRPRRYYRLTRDGRAILVTETDRRAAMVRAAKRRLVRA